ncbi:MAG: sulfatase-like hydrolase/transferase [Verrucomicrobiales bacterium]
MCSPSRAGLMTGRYGTGILGITDWIKPGVEDKLGLPVDSVTHPQLLGAGYRTGLIGKWHLGTQPIQHPTKFGYGYFVGFLTGGNSPKDPTLEKAGETKKFPGLTADVLTDEALEFCARRGTKRSRFSWRCTIARRTPPGCRSRTRTWHRIGTRTSRSRIRTTRSSTSSGSRT